MDLKKEVELHLWRAQTLAQLKRYEEARKEYDKILQLDPNNKDAKKGIEIIKMIQSTQR
jgi:tetratricopeptide (TPR) repeat protein